MGVRLAAAILLALVLAAWSPAVAKDAVAGSSAGSVVAKPPHRPGETFRDCPDCPEMVVVPGGRFAMGSPAEERGRFDAEGPQHMVSVPAFAMGKYDVTVQEFAAFVKATGYDGGACDWPSGATWQSAGFVPLDPVVCLSWFDAKAYVAWLNERLQPAQEGKTAPQGPYRLPSEAEWEYAARAGTRTARWWGEAIGVGHANCNGCGSRWDDKQISEVDSFPPNPFGLNDMLGNVWQWTEDCWNESYLGAPTDGSAWQSGNCRKRVLRGGSWSNLPKFLRAAARNRDDADNRSLDFASYAGFRVVRALP